MSRLRVDPFLCEYPNLPMIIVTLGMSDDLTPGVKERSTGVKKRCIDRYPVTCCTVEQKSFGSPFSQKATLSVMLEYVVTLPSL